MTELRPAAAQDASACAQILRAWYADTPWLPRLHSAAEDTVFLEGLIGRGLVTVARDHGQIKGYMALDGADLMHLYLAPDCRGQGLGTRFVARAQSESVTLTLWCFQANMGARQFYERLGFRAVEMTDGQTNEERLPDIRYEWSVAK